MKLFTQLKRLKNTALLLVLAVFFLADMEANAATAQKETPLTNLAKGKLSITSSADTADSPGSGITNKELLTDGDKYYLLNNTYTNDPNGVGQNRTGNIIRYGNNKSHNQWSNYVEQGAEVSGDSVWIQLDLEDSYPIEVINMKRQVYEGTTSLAYNDKNGGDYNGTAAQITGSAKITYTNTAIVIGNQPDLSDGQVVYYSGNVTLPTGVAVPATSAGTYQELMGGQWFYMDYGNSQGLGQTELGDTKTARYVRVYTTKQGASSVKFMELAVYGYEDVADIQSPQSPSERRVIDNENPMLLSTAYSDDIFTFGVDTDPTLQGHQTVSQRLAAIPDDLKENTVMLLHMNNLRQFAPEHIGQASIQGFFEAGLQQCWEKGTSAMIVGISASSTPGGAQWYPLMYMDYGWLDLMYRMYPIMEGTLNTENYWSGSGPAVAKNSAKQLEMAYKYGGYFIWADQDHSNYVANAFVNSQWKDALSKYGESCFMLYKNTGAQADDLKTGSYHQGNWLAGYTGGWGMLSDTWFWSNKGFGKLFKGKNGNSDWKAICGAPEALLGAQMISAYTEGAVIYTFEFPEVVYGANGKNSPAFTHVVAQLFRYFKDNPAPGKKEILEKTRVILYGSLSKDIYTQTTGAQTGVNVYQTGRFGMIPIALPVESKDAMVARLRQEAARLGLTTAPAVMETSDKNLDSRLYASYYKKLYEKEYEGTAFADKVKDTWYLYNSTLNTDTTQNAALPLAEPGVKGARAELALSPHTYVMLKEESGNNNLELTLNNYRVNKDTRVFDNPKGYDWSGGFAAGSGTLAGKLSVYRYMMYDNVVNADTSNGEQSPDDNVLRTNTIKLARLSKIPTVTLIDGQKPDTDQQPQYGDVQVAFDQTTGIATITITSNGWVKYRITDLEYIEDHVQILQPESTDPLPPATGNLALRKSVTLSKASNDSGRTDDMTDGTINNSNYTDPGGNAGGAQWAQVDLGSQCKIEYVNLIRYWGDARGYNDTVVMLSTESDFPSDKTLVIWNGNRNADQQWPGKGNDSTGTTHKLPVGSDPVYQENTVKEAGKRMDVTDARVKWLDNDSNRAKPASGETFTARYVRVYMNGTTLGGSSNHIVELQVFGEEGEVQLEDITPPETPADLKAVNIGQTVATIEFLPSVDNMGLKEYEVTYKKAGDSSSTTIKITQSSFELTGLEKNTNYEVSVVAVDNYNNKSAASSKLTFITFDKNSITVSASPASGSYVGGQNILLTPTKSGGELYYTTDGTQPFDGQGNPTGTAVRYTEGSPVEMSHSGVLRAAVKKDGSVYAIGVWFYQIGEQSKMDLEAPKAPTAVTVSNISSTGATINWGSASSDVESFYIYVNGAKKAEVSTAQTAMEVSLTDLSPLTAYQIWITAVDGAGNESFRSETMELITRSQ